MPSTTWALCPLWGHERTLQRRSGDVRVALQERTCPASMSARCQKRIFGLHEVDVI